MSTCVTTTASDVSDSNDGKTFGKSGLPRAGCRERTAASGLPRAGCRERAAASGLPRAGCRERAAASGLPRASFAKLRMMWSVPNRKLILRDFFKFVCANSLYRGGPKTSLTDQHLLRTNLFFVTETSELSLAGLM